MMDSVRRAFPMPTRGAALGLGLSLLVIIGTALYVAAYRDVYVVPAMLPFFVLGCARGQHPARLLALSVVPALFLLTVSFVKSTLTGMPLVAYDHYFLRQNVLLLAYNDWRIVLGLTLLIAGLAWYVRGLFAGKGLRWYFAQSYLPRPYFAWSYFERGAVAVLLLVSAFCISDLRDWSPDVFDWEAERTTPSIRVLAESAFIPKAQLHLAPPTETDRVLKNLALGAPAGGLPDVVFILQESSFHPGILRPGYEPKTLFSQKASHTGPLHIHTYGGGTWLAEFSLITQMRPHEFGSEGLYVFHQLEGRVQRSVFSLLKEHGYRSAVIYPVPGDFLNARAFYTSLGVDEFYDPQSLGISTGWNWKIPDSAFYHAVQKKLSESKTPMVVFMLTINQHGPHDAVDPFGDYMARFEHSDADYHDFLDAMAARDHRTGVVAFGDHHPDFTARFLGDKQTWQYTAYDMRCINFACANSAFANRGAKPVDIVMLTPMALEEFGFTLDDFSLVQREIFQKCDDNITLCDPGARTAFNRAFTQFFN